MTSAIGRGFVEELNDATFSHRIASGLWMVEFWSPDCRPCLAVSPVVHALAGEYGRVAQFGSVNVDTELKTSLSQRVMGVPTVVLFQDGRPADVLYTTYPAHIYRERLMRLVNPSRP